MGEVLNTIISLVATILTGVFAIFLLVLEDNKEKLWERIKRK